MTGNEPLLLYTGQQQMYSLFSWRESDNESFFVAVRGEKARQELTRAVRSASGQAKIRIADEHLSKNGGILLSAVRNEEGGYRLVRRPQDSKRAKARGYIPPASCQIFDPEGTVTSRTLTSEGIDLSPLQYALVPVDEDAQKQLQSTVHELDLLPGDLRSEMFEILTGHAALKAAVPALKEKPPSANFRFAWPWVVMALILGFAGGCAGYALYSNVYSAGRHAEAEKAIRHSTIDPILGDFDAAMKQSVFPVFGTLYEFHFAPLLVTAGQGAAGSSLESWMLLKVALYRHKPPADSGPEVLPSTVNWSQSSNEEAKADFIKKEALSFQDLNAIRAATCLDGVPSAAFASPEDCSKVNWEAASGDLKALTAYVRKLSSPAGPQNSSVPLQAQPEAAAPTQNSVDPKGGATRKTTADSARVGKKK